eukprot:scaffold116133_cov32-Tisochrysis_lutea.AAC.3
MRALFFVGAVRAAPDVAHCITRHYIDRYRGLTLAVLDPRPSTTAVVCVFAWCQCQVDTDKQDRDEHEDDKGGSGEDDEEGGDEREDDAVVAQTQSLPSCSCNGGVTLTVCASACMRNVQAHDSLGTR